MLIVQVLIMKKNLEQVVELWGRNEEAIRRLAVSNYNSIKSLFSEVYNNKKNIDDEVIEKVSSLRKELADTIIPLKGIIDSRPKKSMEGTSLSTLSNYDTLLKLFEHSEKASDFILSKIEHEFNENYSKLQDAIKNKDVVLVRKFRKALESSFNHYTRVFDKLTQGIVKKLTNIKASNKVMFYKNEIDLYNKYRREIDNLKQTYLKKDWNQSNISSLRKKYSEFLGKGLFKKDKLSILRQHGFLDLFEDAHRLTEEMKFYFSNYEQINNVKLSINKTTEKFDSELRKLTKINILDSRNIDYIVILKQELKKLEVPSEFKHLEYLDSSLQNYSSKKKEIEELLDVKVNHFVKLLKQELKQISNVKPEFRSLETDTEIVEEALRKLRFVKNNYLLLSRSFDVEPLIFDEVEKKLNNYSEIIQNADSEISDLLGDRDYIKETAEELIENGNKRQLISFKNELDVMEKEYRNKLDQPYIKKIVEDNLEYIIKTRDSISHMLNVLREEDDKKKEIQKLKRNQKELYAEKERLEEELKKKSEYITKVSERERELGRLISDINSKLSAEKKSKEELQDKIKELRQSFNKTLKELETKLKLSYDTKAKTSDIASDVNFNVYLYFSSLGPTPNPDNFAIREYMLDLKPENLEQTVKKIYYVVSAINTARTHSELSYRKQLLEGYKSFAYSSPYSDRINGDDKLKRTVEQTITILERNITESLNFLEPFRS